MMDRLLRQISVLLNSPILTDARGVEYIVSGFHEDGDALLSRLDGKAQHYVKASRLDAFKIGPPRQRNSDGVPVLPST